MQSQEGKTKMVAPHESTNMTANAVLICMDAKKIPEDKKKVTEGMVRIQAIRPVADGAQFYAEGAVLDCTPEFAKEFCDTKFEGPASHSGEILATNAKKHEIVRAIRLS